MKTKPVFRWILPAVLFSMTHIATAQLDSMYTQQWNRDPVTDLKYTASAQRQIITAEQIRASGYITLTEVLQLIDGWTYSRPYQYGNWIMQSNGLENFDYQNWVLMVNGQRIEPNRISGVDINGLSISANNIERIEVINSNGMYLGEFTQNGLINIITKKNTINGFLANAYLVTNTQYSTTAFTLGYTQNRFHLNISLGNPFYTDLRDLTLYSNDIHPRLEMQYSGNKISHQVQFVTLSSNYSTTGYLGLWNLNARHQIRLSSSLAVNSDNLYYTQNNPNRFLNTLQHRFLKNSSKGNFIWQTGLGFDYAKISQVSNGQPLFITKPYTSINIPVTRKVNLFADGQAAFSHNKIAPKITVGIYKRISLISNYSFALGYTETLLEEYFNTNIGKQVNAIDGTNGFYNPKVATADLYYNLNIGNSVKFSFNSGLKQVYDLPGYVISGYSPDEFTYISINDNRYFRYSTHQLNWINRFNIHYDIVKNLVFDINYLHTNRLNTWNNNFHTIPKHKFSVTVQYDLPKRFTLWSRYYFQSKTQNRFYLQPYSDYISSHYTTPRYFTWDIGISKKLWKDYLNLNFSARDIFTKYRTYTSIDDYVSERFMISLTANMDGLFAKGNPKP